MDIISNYAILARKEFLNRIKNSHINNYFSQGFLFVHKEPDKRWNNEQILSAVKILFLIDILSDDGQEWYSEISSDLKISLKVFDQNFEIKELVHFSESKEIEKYCNSVDIPDFDLTGDEQVDKWLVNRLIK